MKYVIAIVAVVVAVLAIWKFVQNRQADIKAQQDFKDTIAAEMKRQEELEKSLNKGRERERAKREGWYVPKPGPPLSEPIKIGETTESRMILLCGTPDDKSTLETEKQIRETYIYREPDDRAYECLGTFIFTNGTLESISR